VHDRSKGDYFGSLEYNSGDEHHERPFVLYKPNGRVAMEVDYEELLKLVNVSENGPTWKPNDVRMHFEIRLTVQFRALCAHNQREYLSSVPEC